MALFVFCESQVVSGGGGGGGGSATNFNQINGTPITVPLTNSPMLTNGLPTYLGQFMASNQQTAAQLTGQFIPNMPLGGQVIPMSEGYMVFGGGTGPVGQGQACAPNAALGGTNACSYDNLTVFEEYADGLARSGVKIFTVNIFPQLMASTSQFTTACSNWDTAHGVGSCTGFNMGSAYPAGQNDCAQAGGGFMCLSLANVDSWMTYIGSTYPASSGFRVHFRISPLGLKNQCGFVSATTAASYEGCIFPLAIAMANRYTTGSYAAAKALIYGIDILHESNGIFPTQTGINPSTTFSQTIANDWNSNMATINTANGTSMIDSISEAIGPGLSSYVTAEAAGTTSLIGLDVYQGQSCTPDTYLANALTGSIINAKTIAPKPWAIMETARPRYLGSGCSGFSETSTLEGMGGIDWGLLDLDSRWMQVTIPWWAMNGAQFVSQFNTQIFFCYVNATAGSLTQGGVPSGQFSLTMMGAPGFGSGCLLEQANVGATHARLATQSQIGSVTLRAPVTGTPGTQQVVLAMPLQGSLAQTLNQQGGSKFKITGYISATSTINAGNNSLFVCIGTGTAPVTGSIVFPAANITDCSTTGKTVATLTTAGGTTATAAQARFEFDVDVRANAGSTVSVETSSQIVGSTASQGWYNSTTPQQGGPTNTTAININASPIFLSLQANGSATNLTSYTFQGASITPLQQ